MPAEFGFAGRVPFSDGSVDATEVDMKIGGVVVEAKLTEVDFTHRPIDVLRRYRDFAAVFHEDVLDATDDEVGGYQLIRNILCAQAYGFTFTLVCDARRPDLIRHWWHVTRTVRSVSLRARLRLVLWQELAVQAPAPLARFLTSKYGL